MIERVQHNELPTDYGGFLQDILMKIQQTRYEMLMSVSKQTLLLYWDIGRAVSEKMQSAVWGTKVVTQLSKDLQTEIPGVRGFSARNIWRMKMFYDFYAGFGITATAVAQLGGKQNCVVEMTELTTEGNQSTVDVQNSATVAAELQIHIYELITSVGWVQNCIILEKCENIEQVAFYLKQTKEKGWSKLDLLEKIEQNYFENHVLVQNNFSATVPDTLKAQVAWEFLDDYNIELLNADQPVSEKALENAIIENLVKFLHEMYMQLINKRVKQPFHNNTIGIILCRSKNRLEVEYMLEQSRDPMGVATYNRYSQLPEEYAKYLPSEEEITKRLSLL